MIVREVMTIEYRMPKGMCLIDARCNVREDLPADDEDIVFRFAEITKRGQKVVYAVVRVLKDEVRRMREEAGHELGRTV